ncbi:hypothetical protein AAT17_12485 [Nonlabens sp. MIC269]|nr:hypothetical protein AAT17_12485 [Nonlabens sp. MIC269]
MKQDERIRKLKGEDFNIFKICKIEHYEENTHSAFIAELLNPKGSHHKGNVFLKLFLNRVLKDNLVLKTRSDDYMEFSETFLSHGVVVKKEQSVGKINLKKGTGGRIDILLKSKNQYITIENKIYATDQNGQLVRYYNYQRDNNLVIYLTLDGIHAAENSIQITNGKNEVIQSLNESDYQRISYSKDIRLWIEDCLQHAYNEPILRESLKQYLLLIKKLTFQMDESLKNQMTQLLKDNFKIASTIHHNYYNVKNEIKREIKNDVFKSLKEQVEKFGLDIYHGNDVNYKFSQIWLHTKGVDDHVLRFSIESFKGDPKSHHEGKLMIGVFNKTRDEKIAKQIRPDCQEWFVFPEWEQIYDTNSKWMNLSKLDTLNLFLDSKTRQQNIDLIVNTSLEFIKKYYQKVNEINLENA